jgi:hypothetical protein
MVEEGIVVYHPNRSIHKDPLLAMVVAHLLPRGITIIKDTTVALPMVVVVQTMAVRHIIMSHQVNIIVDGIMMKVVIQAMDMDGVIVVLEYETP